MDKNEKIWSRFYGVLFREIDFTAYGLPRNHAPAWELSGKFYLFV